MTPLLMGILNAGPDSFSDPGRRSAEELASRGRALAEQGAAIVDVGGESGRSDRPAVTVQEEIARVSEPIRLLAEAGVRVSVDTWRAVVARAALAAGASLVNDPSGLSEPELADACAEAGAGLVITHTRVAPKTKGFPAYDDVVEDACTFLAERLEEALRRGVDPDGVLLDPGIDLGKTPAESVELLRRLDDLGALGRPLLVAVSRKDFIGALGGRPPAERGGGTLAALGAAADRGADVLRVHDVAAAHDFLAVRAALRGEALLPPDLRLAEGLRTEPVS